MVTSSWSFRAFLSGPFPSLLLASIVADQDKPSSAPISLDPAALLIPKQKPLVGMTPEKTSVAQDGLFDFTLPRLMKPVGLIPSSDRGGSYMATEVNRTASGVIRITPAKASAEMFQAELDYHRAYA